MTDPLETKIILQVNPGPKDTFRVHWAEEKNGQHDTGSAFFIDRAGLRVWLASLEKRIPRGASTGNQNVK